MMTIFFLIVSILKDRETKQFLVAYMCSKFPFVWTYSTNSSLRTKAHDVTSRYTKFHAPRHTMIYQ